MAPEDVTPPTRVFWTEPAHVMVEGIETAYRRKGEGEVVLYLHGGGATRAWFPFHEALSQGADLVAPEHPGFGDTPRATHMDSWADWILFYDAFMRELDLDQVHLVGNSLGAWLAANLAVYYPMRFKSMTLLTPMGLRIPDAPLIDPFRWLPEQEAEAMFNGRAEAYAGYFVHDGEPKDGIHGYEEETTSALLMWNPRYDIKLDHRLARFERPSLVIGAEQDGVVGPGMAERFTELLPDARLETPPGPDGRPSSHLMFIEQPEDVAALILDHVRKHG